MSTSIEIAKSDKNRQFQKTTWFLSWCNFTHFPCQTTAHQKSQNLITCRVLQTHVLTWLIHDLKKVWGQFRKLPISVNQEKLIKAPNYGVFLFWQNHIFIELDFYFWPYLNEKKSAADNTFQPSILDFYKNWKLVENGKSKWFLSN